MGAKARGTIAVLLLTGCAHHPLSSSDLSRVRRPAFISRIEENAGPLVTVFRSDSSYRSRLGNLDRREADRRLQARLAKSMSRFEVSDRLRADIVAQLPKQKPWDAIVAPSEVATLLESFLVEEVPANPPDYDLLKAAGADAVVELVIEGYGLRSARGKAEAFLHGYGRMFFIDQEEIWREGFDADQVESKPAVDPLVALKDPEGYRTALASLIDQMANRFSKELAQANP